MPNPPDIPTPDELRDLLVKVIIGVNGEPASKWRKIVGEIKMLPTWRYPRCNWRVQPKGTKAQIAVVEQCVAIVAAEHP